MVSLGEKYTPVVLNGLGAIFAVLSYQSFGPETMPIWLLYVIIGYLVWLGLFQLMKIKAIW